MKNNKGITLIALVVTIIVLLILAGVSIAMLTGQNGILNRSQEASIKNSVADAKDQIALKVAECITNWNAVKYGETNSTNLTNYNADLDLYIYKELSAMKSNLESNDNVTITITEVPSEGETAGKVPASAKISIVSKKDNTVKTECTWTDGGVLGAWTATAE